MTRSRKSKSGSRRAVRSSPPAATSHSPAGAEVLPYDPTVFLSPATNSEDRPDTAHRCASTPLDVVPPHDLSLESRCASSIAVERCLDLRSSASQTRSRTQDTSLPKPSHGGDRMGFSPSNSNLNLSQHTAVFGSGNLEGSQDGFDHYQPWGRDRLGSPATASPSPIRGDLTGSPLRSPCRTRQPNSDFSPPSPVDDGPDLANTTLEGTDDTGCFPSAGRDGAPPTVALSGELAAPLTRSPTSFWRRLREKALVTDRPFSPKPTLASSVGVAPSDMSMSSALSNNSSSFVGSSLLASSGESEDDLLTPTKSLRTAPTLQDSTGNLGAEASTVYSTNSSLRGASDAPFLGGTTTSTKASSNGSDRRRDSSGKALIGRGQKKRRSVRDLMGSPGRGRHTGGSLLATLGTSTSDKKQPRPSRVDTNLLDDFETRFHKHYSVFSPDGVDAGNPPLIHYLHLGRWCTLSCEYFLHRFPAEGESRGHTVMWLHTARPRDRFVFLISPVEATPQPTLLSRLWRLLYGEPPNFALSGGKVLWSDGDREEAMVAPVTSAPTDHPTMTSPEHLSGPNPSSGLRSPLMGATSLRGTVGALHFSESTPTTKPTLSSMDGGAQLESPRQPVHIGITALEVMHDDVTAMDFSAQLMSARLSLETKLATCRWFSSKEAALRHYDALDKLPFYTQVKTGGVSGIHMRQRMQVVQRLQTRRKLSKFMPKSGPAVGYPVAGVPIVLKRGYKEGDEGAQIFRTSSNSTQHPPSSKVPVQSMGFSGNTRFLVSVAAKAPTNTRPHQGEGLSSPPVSFYGRVTNQSDAEANTPNSGSFGDPPPFSLSADAATILERMQTPIRQDQAPTCDSRMQNEVASDQPSEGTSEIEASLKTSSPPLVSSVIGRIQSHFSRRDADLNVRVPDGHITTTHTNTMVVIYSQDPYFTHMLRELLAPESGTEPSFTTSKLSQQRLLSLCEAGMPSWTIFFSRWGLPYRRWFRLLAVTLLNIWPLIALCVGAYDLYKHMPHLRNFMADWFAPLSEWVNRNFALSVSIYLTYMMSVSLTVFQSLHSLVRTVTHLVTVLISPLRPFLDALGMVYPAFMYLLGFVWALFSPVIALGKGLIHLVLSPYYLARYMLSFIGLFASPGTARTVQSASSYALLWRYWLDFWETVARPIKNLAKAFYDGIVHVGVAISKRDASMRLVYRATVPKLQRVLTTVVLEWYQLMSINARLFHAFLPHGTGRVVMILMLLLLAVLWSWWENSDEAMQWEIGGLRVFGFRSGERVTSRGCVRDNVTLLSSWFAPQEQCPLDAPPEEGPFE